MATRCVIGTLLALAFAGNALAATPAQRRVQAAAQLQRTFEVELSGWGLKFAARGKQCDVLHVEASEVNLYSQMMEAMAYGTVEYGRILPGGVNKNAFAQGFRTVVYTNAHNQHVVSFGEPKLSKTSVQKLRICTDAIAAKLTAPERPAAKTYVQPSFEPLSWGNVQVGVKLYGGTFKHEATVVGIDRNSGIIRVRYVRSGTVEPKLLEAVSRYWYVSSASR